MSNEATVRIDAEIHLTVVGTDSWGNGILYTEALGQAAAIFQIEELGCLPGQRPRSLAAVRFFAQHNVPISEESALAAFHALVNEYNQRTSPRPRPGPLFGTVETGRTSAANPPRAAMPSSPFAITAADTAQWAQAALRQADRVAAWEGVGAACRSALRGLMSSLEAFGQRQEAIKLHQFPLAVAWSAYLALEPMLIQLSLPDAGGHPDYPPSLVFSMAWKMALLTHNSDGHEYLRRIYRALERLYRGTEHEQHFPGDYVVREDLPWGPQQEAPSAVYRKITVALTEASPEPEE